VASSLSRLTGYHGTALPGLVACRIDPTILSSLGHDLGPIILVVGTNGKTTTTRLTAAVLERVIGVRPVSNRSGANLTQGVLSAILADGSAIMRRRPAVFEVDELAFPAVAEALQPDVVVMLNLVRDQLDRYGEVDAIERRWIEVLSSLSPDTRVVICADDPRLESIVRGTGLSIARFGILGEAGPARSRLDERSSRESIGAPCPACGVATGVGDAEANAGDWRCSACGFRRAALDLGVRVEDTDGDWLCLAFEADADDAALPDARVRLTGTAGAHDAAASVLVAVTLGVDVRQAIAAVDGATPAFGRLEEIPVEGRRVVLTLAKNPASAAQATEAVVIRRPEGVLLGLGDRPADGRDVSWIWDAPLDELASVAPLTLTGDRADDLALRFKYAEAFRDGRLTRPVVDVDIERALDSSLHGVRPGGSLMVLGTYTTLLGIRAMLERRGLASEMPR